MKQRNVLLVIQSAYPERISGIARFARSHGWHLTIVDREHFASLNFRHFAWFSIEWSHVHELRIRGFAGDSSHVVNWDCPLKCDRLFAEKFSRSVGREIVRQRTERAKRLLSTTDKPMKEIAAECGFCSQAYLTDLFKATTGLTPLKYRNQLIAFNQ